MHGSVTEFDDDYMEKYVPAYILTAMHDTPESIDSDGFTWGFNKVFADLHEGKPYICVASKYMGQGYSEIKCIIPHSTKVHKMIVTFY